jgi:hypothetical protein
VSDAEDSVKGIGVGYDLVYNRYLEFSSALGASRALMTI